MDIKSLPNELVAGILKYSSFGTARKVRKLDSQLDRIFRSYHLRFNVPVRNLQVQYATGGRPVKTGIRLTARFSENIQDYLRKKKAAQEKVVYYDMTAKGAWFPLKKNEEGATELLKNVKVREILCNKVASIIDSRFINFLIGRKQDLRELTCIVFNYPRSKFVVSRPKLIEFLTSYKFLKSISLIGNSVISAFMNVEVLGSRKWNKLFLYVPKETQPTEMKQIDSTFFNQVIKNTKIFCCINVGFEQILAFTVTDLLDIIETCLLEPGYFSNQQWDFPVLALGDTTVTDLEERLNKNEAISYRFADHQGSETYDRCKITIQPNARINFSFERGDIFETDNTPDLADILSDLEIADDDFGSESDDFDYE